MDKPPGLTLADFQQLPQPQQHLINWIRQQGECRLLDIAVHLCQDEDTILEILALLTEKGFIEEIESDDAEISYRVKHPPRRGKPLMKKLLKKKNEPELDNS